jgi:hypothetical protein
MFKAMIAAFWVGYALCAVLVAVVGYWLIAPYNIVTEFSRVPKVETPVVQQGGLLIYTGYMCKSTDDGAVLSREFVDGVKYITPDITQNFYPKGCRDLRPAVAVPMIPPGVYRLHMTARFKVNPLRVKTYDYWTEPCSVVA